MALGLHPDTLSTINANYSDVEICLRAVITEWLKKSYDTTKHGQPSWERLVKAVADRMGGNDYALADRLARKHDGKLKDVHYMLSMFYYTVRNM